MRRIFTTTSGWQQELRTAIRVDTATNAEVQQAVSDIITAVQQRGDNAVLEYTSRFDNITYTTETVRVTREEIDAAYAACTPDAIAALKAAHARILSYHQMQLPQDHRYADDHGNMLGWRWTPVDAVGLYVPGGKASYPSSVLMNAVPAKVAGVQRIAMVVPTPQGVLNPLVLAAAHIAGVTEIYKIGGAQAVAALAYGTASITSVDMIVGPGNAYVAETKRQVFGTVGIDMIAGPSEILVIADAQQNPEWIAADLLSQAEHDADARCFMITNDEAFATKVEQAVTQQLAKLSRSVIASESWHRNAVCVIVDTLHEPAVEAANIIASEHLEICVEAPDYLVKNIRHAGALFIGRYTPEAIGDYVAGPSHVLPTAQSARFSSGLGVLTFMKRTSLIGCTEAGFHAIADHADVLAQAESLTAHARSVTIRKA